MDENFGPTCERSSLAGKIRCVAGKETYCFAVDCSLLASGTLIRRYRSADLCLKDASSCCS